MFKANHHISLFFLAGVVFLIASGEPPRTGTGSWANQPEPQSIAELKGTVNDRKYGNYWDRLSAIKQLGKLNNPESTVILASLLDDAEAPIREAAVMALSNLADPVSIKYLSANALVDPKSPQTRAHAAWALGLIKSPDTLDDLVKALNDADEAVQLKVIEAIGGLANNASAVEHLLKKLNAGSPVVKSAAALALGQTKSESVLVHLQKKLNDPQWLVRSGALEAIAGLNPEEAFAHLVVGLKDPAPQVRITALESLARVPPDKNTALKLIAELFSDKVPAVRTTAIRLSQQVRERKYIPFLVDRLKEAQWQLRYDIIMALQDITGISGKYSPTAWISWYDANKDKIEVMSNPAILDSKPDETIPTFFTIPVMGKNIVFIIDFSGSMKNEASSTAGVGGEPPRSGEPPRTGTGERKIDIAMKELENTLTRLNQQVQFNIIAMSTEVKRFNKRKVSPTMLTANDPNKKSAMAFIRSLWDQMEDIKRGRGDLYDAVMEAMAEPIIDTIFILSDGKPTYGAYIVDQNIISHLNQENRFRKIAMHTILIGEKGTNPELMKKIAEISNGMFIQK